MKVNEFKNTTEYNAIVCNENGKAWRLGKQPAKVGNQEVIGTDLFPTETGKILYVWVA